MAYIGVCTSGGRRSLGACIPKPGASWRRSSSSWVQPDFLPAVRARLSGNAAPLLAVLAEFQVLNVLSTAGATILAVGYVLPMVYFLWSMRYGKVADENPWGATGLEWMTASPPPTFNFDETPVVTWKPTDYANLKEVPV